MDARHSSDDDGYVYVRVDTRQGSHHVSAIGERGRQFGDRKSTTGTDGYGQICRFIGSFGANAVVAVEGTGSYGAELTRVLRRAGLMVREVPRPDRSKRRLHGKSDPLDGLQAVTERTLQ